LLSAFFGVVELDGQHRLGRRQVRLMARLGAVWPRGAVAWRQMMKAPWWIADAPSRHAVEPLAPGWEYEYLLAVCRQPRGASA
jgi:hypothetical protein